MKRIYVLFALTVWSTHSTETLKDTISEVVHAITKESYFPVDVKQATLKALDTFSRQVDEYTRFLGPEEYKELIATTDGSYYGIGVELGPKKETEEFLMILKVLPNSPAEKVGLKRYDKILAVDDSPVGPLSMSENLKKLHGEKRFSPVKLTVLQGTAPARSITIKRDQLPTNNAWCAYLPEQRIVYCHINLFTHQVPSQVRSALTKSLKKNPRGIILDLRDNAGGLLKAAVSCASLFLPKKSLIVPRKNRNGKVLNRYATHEDPLVPSTVPVVILVNQYTASSAEILAQTLRHYSAHNKRVSPHIVIVGTQTYGKGSVQDVRPIGSECALKVTTALYYLPDNSSIQEKGVTPDFVIKQTYPASHDVKLLNRLYSPRKKSRKKDAVLKSDNDTLRLQALKKDPLIVNACNLILLLDQGRSAAPQQVSTHSKAVAWLKKRFVVPKTMRPVIL